jgi:uncharacterized membrane protein YjgN (DUF898 family)
MKIKYTGNFWDYFLKALGILVLCVLTVGILTPYYFYWTFKYFFDHLELEDQPVIKSSS